MADHNPRDLTTRIRQVLARTDARQARSKRRVAAANRMFDRAVDRLRRNGVFR